MCFRQCCIAALVLCPLIACAGGPATSSAGFTIALRIRAPSPAPDACQFQNAAAYSDDWSQPAQAKGQYVNLMRSQDARQRADRYFQSRCSMELLCKTLCLAPMASPRWK